jgi:hypothetical protein
VHKRDRVDGRFFWVGEVPTPRLTVGVIEGQSVDAASLVDALTEYTMVVRAPINAWQVEGARLLVEGARIDADAAARAVVLFNHKGEAGASFEHAMQIERWFRSHAPTAMILHPPSGAAVFRSKIAFYEAVGADPAIQHLVPAHQVIVANDDIDAAIARFGFPIVVKADDLSKGDLMEVVTDRASFVKHVQTIRAYATTPQRASLPSRVLAITKSLLRRGKWRDHHYRNNGRVLANPFVETFDPVLGGRLGLGLHYFGAKLTALRPKLIEDGWSSHLQGRNVKALEGLSRDQFHHLSERLASAVERQRETLAAVARALPSWPLRLDAMLQPSSEILISEPEMKWGYKNHPFPKLCQTHQIDVDALARRTGLAPEIDLHSLATARQPLR